MTAHGPSRQTAFFGPTVANGAFGHCWICSLPPPSRSCRVGPGNFTPSLSQDSGREAFDPIRLVPPREGCRLPLFIGLLLRPVTRPQLTRSNVDDPPPSLHEHYTRFIAVGSEEAPNEELASVRRTNRTYSFPVSGFHERAFAICSEGMSEHPVLHRLAPLAGKALPLPLDTAPLIRAEGTLTLLISCAAQRTLRGSPPLSGASVLSASRLEPLVPFPLTSPARFSRSIQEPGRASRRQLVPLVEAIENNLGRKPEQASADFWLLQRTQSGSARSTGTKAKAGV